ncbi:MAG: urease accessory protein UreE [Pseudomonadota bacterium]
MTLPRATSVADGTADDHVALDYEGRLIRRRRLESAGGVAFLVDLPEVVSIEDGQCLVLEDGRRVAVAAADEALLEVRGDLARLAWHIGNRHTPCRIEADRLVIREDYVLRAMLERLGAEVTEATGPFVPEGGAYGHGRTFGHEHSHSHD